MPTFRLPFYILTVLLSLSELSGQSTEQNEESKRLKIHSDIQVGVLVGGQISNEQFVYKPGLITQYSINKRLSPWISAGLGMGFELLDTETIIPFFVDVKAQLKEARKASFVGVNIGSSSGWSTYYRNFADYEYSGGFYFSPYYSLSFPVSDQVDFLLATGYIHQVGWIEYFTEYDESYLENFSMDFLTIRAGLRF